MRSAKHPVPPFSKFQFRSIGDEALETGSNPVEKKSLAPRAPLYGMPNPIQLRFLGESTFEAFRTMKANDMYAGSPSNRSPPSGGPTNVPKKITTEGLNLG